MEIRYKKVTVLYAVLALMGILVFKSFFIKPISQLSQVRSLQRQVCLTEKTVKEQIQYSRVEPLNDKSGVRNLLLSALSVIAESGCPVISGVPSRQKTPEACPMYDLDIVFGGEFPDILTAMSALDSLTASCPFEAVISSCRISSERSSDGRQWSLVCRETIQCFPTAASTSKKRDDTLTETICDSPFYLPRIKTESQEEPLTNSFAYNYPERPLPQGRLIGRIGSGREAVVMVEIGGECVQLHYGDGILLKDYGDSVKIALDIDTVIFRLQ